MPDSLARSSALTVQLHSLAIEGKLAISTVAPCSQKSRKWLGFPDPDDGPAYGDRSWSLLDKWYPPSRCHVDLAELQRYVCAWRCDYTQVCAPRSSCPALDAACRRGARADPLRLLVVRPQPPMAHHRYARRDGDVRSPRWSA